MDDFGEKKPTIFGNIHIVFYAFSICSPFSCFTWSLDFKGAEKVRRSGNRDLWSWSVSSDSNIRDPYFMVYTIIPIYNWVGFFIPYIIYPIYPKQLAFFLFSLLKCVSSDSMESHNIPNVFPCFFSRILWRIRANFSHPVRRSLKSCDQGTLGWFLELQPPSGPGQEASGGWDFDWKKQLVRQMLDAKSPNFDHEIMFRMAKTKIIPT